MELTGLKTANFIYIKGYDYHEKVFTYEEWPDGIEIVESKNIRYNATDVSSRLMRSMKREIGVRFSHVLSDHPFHMERITFDRTNDTKQLVMVGENSLFVKRGSFGDDKILRKFSNYWNQYRGFISSHDLSQSDIYESMIDTFMKLMNDEIDAYFLRSVCSVVPPDVYLEMLCVLNELGGICHYPSKFCEESNQKVKRLIEYSK